MWKEQAIEMIFGRHYVVLVKFSVMTMKLMKSDDVTKIRHLEIEGGIFKSQISKMTKTRFLGILERF